MIGSGSFSSLHVLGAAVGKNLYLFSGTQSCILSFSVLNVRQFLSAAPCPLAHGSLQFAHLNEAVSVMLHCDVLCCSPHHAQVLVVTLQSGT